MAGKAADKLAITAIRDFLCNLDGKLTKEECGKIVKQAFPGVCRRSCNSKWFYYGLQHITRKETNTTPSSSKKEPTEQPCENAIQSACNTNHQQDASSPKSGHSSVLQTEEQQPSVKLRPFCIPSLNLCKEDMSDFAHGSLIGEGTFGQCVAGTYKGIPVAFKVYKDVRLASLEDVHAEAKILLKIPSHPGIPLLIGIHTTSSPFVLATKLCKTAGRPETYSCFLKECEHSRQNLCLALQLLLSVAEALHHIFSVGVLHNDVKGNNIVLEDAQGVKRGVIIDFGKACFIENAKGLYGTVHV